MKSYAKASHGNSGSRNIFGNSILIGNWLVSGYYTYFIKKTHRKLTCTRTTGDWSFVNMYFWRCQCPSFNLWEDNQMNVDSGLHSHHSTHIFIFIFIAEHNFYYCVCQSACKASFVSNLFFFFSILAYWICCSRGFFSPAGLQLFSDSPRLHFESYCNLHL